MTGVGKTKFTSGHVVEAIRQKYKDGQRYAVLTEVANGTGGNCRSWVDAVVIALWPSDGLTRSAYEVKVSRADFMVEMKDPQKNEWAREAFDYFYYATAPGVVKALDEIPEGCGWYVLTEGGLRCHKVATRRADPKLNTNLLAAIARAAMKESVDRVARAEREILAKNTDVAWWRAHYEGVSHFLNERGCRRHCRTKDEVLAALREAVVDKSVDELREIIRRQTGDFQSAMKRLFWQMAGLAFVAFEERDALGGYFAKYGLGFDEAELAKRAKNDYEKRQQAEKDKVEAMVRELCALVRGEQP